jgi:hypothetical protein
MQAQTKCPNQDVEDTVFPAVISGDAPEYIHFGCSNIPTSMVYTPP